MGESVTLNATPVPVDFHGLFRELTLQADTAGVTGSVKVTYRGQMNTTTEADPINQDITLDGSALAFYLTVPTGMRGITLTPAGLSGAMQMVWSVSGDVEGAGVVT